MPRERAEIIAALSDSAKGFAPPRNKRDHDFFFFQHPDRIGPVFTKVSRGSQHRTIDDSLLGRMSRQLHLTRKQFDALIDCTINEPELAEILYASGILRRKRDRA